MRSLFRMALGWLLCVALLVGPAVAADTEALLIESQAGPVHTFFVQVARTSKERETGLMFREELSPNGGMLFDFDRPQPVAMWMRNTLIPLDMIFIEDDGRIAGIAENTVPHSLDIIRSPGPVSAVLEIKGGMSERLQLKAGDRVRHSMFE